MGTAILFHPTKQQPEMVPDPLRSELRTLAALAGGGRYALVPAGLTDRRAGGPAGGRGAPHPPAGPPARPPAAPAGVAEGLGGGRTRRGGVRPGGAGGG